MKIVFACLGNAGLSAIAENILRKMLRDHEIIGFELSSCGIHEIIDEKYHVNTILGAHAVENRAYRQKDIIIKATREMSRISMENGYDEISEPVRFSPELLKSADLIISMDRATIEAIMSFMGDEVNEKIILFIEYCTGKKTDGDGYVLMINYDYFFGVGSDFQVTESVKEEFSNVFKNIERGCYKIMFKLFNERIASQNNSSVQNEFQREGRRFIESVKEYFKRFHQEHGDVFSFFKNLPQPVSQGYIPDPTIIAEQMNMISYPDGYRLPLCVLGTFNVFAILNFGNEQDFSDNNSLRVKCCAMGAFQTVLLRVLSWHIMPLHCRAYTYEWNPVLSDKELHLFRMETTKRANTCRDIYASIIPKNLPTKPTVKIADDGKTFEVVFYIWSDFDGYLKVVSMVRFPSSDSESLIKDIAIEIDWEVILPYNCGIHYSFKRI